MPLTPAILPHHLAGTVRISTLVLVTEHTSEAMRPVPLTPTVGPSTLMIHAKLPSLLRESSIAPRMPTLVILAELAPTALVRTRTSMTPMIPAVRCQAPVVVHVAPPHAARALAATVLVAVASRVARRDVAVVED